MVGFKQLLIQRKPSILQRWVDLIVATYPAHTSTLMRQERDPFSNPVGHTLTIETEALYEGLLRGDGADRLSGHLDKIVQIRSVQDFSPSRAVAVVPLLKEAVRKEIEQGGFDDSRLMVEWLEFDARIDQLSLLAFDLYAKNREKICEIRIDEMRKERDRALRMLRLTNPREKHRDPETSSG